MTHLNDTQNNTENDAQDLGAWFDAIMAEMDKPPVLTPKEQAIMDDLEATFAEFLA